jgi:hypothetical protein
MQFGAGIDRSRMASLQIIRDKDAMPLGNGLLNEMTADVAGSTGNEQVHLDSLLNRKPIS